MGETQDGGIKAIMKVLYIGHYKESSGWSNAAINNILALDSVGVDVVCRNIKLTNSEANVPQKILELESKSLNDIDYCIQHVLPHHLSYTTKFKKNIAYFVHESNTIKNNEWYVYLQSMDEVWVPSFWARKNLLNDKLLPENRIKVIHHAFDIFRYQEEYPKINLQNVDHTFKFYTIADINDRKNIESIIRCFYAEFEDYEQVTLLLKLKKYGYDANTLGEYIKNITNNVKKNLRLKKNPKSFPNQAVLVSDLSQEQIYSLHQTCDCFIGTSHGEGWSIPAFEAMCFGKTPICSNEGGPSEFINKENKSTGTLINGVSMICNHSDPAFPNIFTGKEEWFQPSESEIKKAMRYYFENKDSIDRIQGIKEAKKFNFESVGNKMKESLQ